MKFPRITFKEDRILFAESGILDVFDIEIISGNAKEALSQPWQTILSESTAKRYFGEEDPIGKTLTYDGEHTLTVAGVMKIYRIIFTSLPLCLVSYLVETDYMGFNMKGWGFTFGASTYIVLKEGTEVSAVKGPIQGVYDKFANTDPDDPEISRADLQPIIRNSSGAKIQWRGELDKGHKYKMVVVFWVCWVNRIVFGLYQFH